SMPVRIGASFDVYFNNTLTSSRFNDSIPCKRRIKMVLCSYTRRAMAVSRIALFLAALALIPTSQAQSTSASLSGVVADEQHARIPGAKITLINQDQGSTAGERFSGEDGSFRFPSLNPATYTLSVEASGF